jgi:hypothetical protein
MELDDTSSDAHRIQYETLRRMTVAQRWAVMDDLTMLCGRWREKAIAEAAALRSTFNAIHNATSFKRLDRWAEDLKVSDLLARARSEIGDR